MLRFGIQQESPFYTSTSLSLVTDNGSENFSLSPDLSNAARLIPERLLPLRSGQVHHIPEEELC